MNRINKLFGVELPIVQAGMIWCSGWELAAAVSNSGGLGLIGSGSMYPEVLRQHIQKCKQATTKPFGVNVPLLYPDIDKLIEVIMTEQVKVVFTSAGNPKTWTQKLKDQGITVAHLVSNSVFAKKSEDAGVDAVVAEGFEAGGHNGREETTTMCLVPIVKNAVKIPVIAAGGIATGRGMLAAMALGADGVQIGSRFVASEEASANINFKKAIIDSKEGDTKLMLKQLTPVRLLRNDFFEKVQQAEANGASLQDLTNLLARGRAKKGMFEGDLSEGELEIGQIAALIRDIKPAQDIVQEIIMEFEAAKKELQELRF
ncbi:MAG TPA: nitronate monooxygenase [Bacteroidia bacterium]|nr:nitronate monooxygenase [Bacteroidia bacterium]